MRKTQKSVLRLKFFVKERARERNKLFFKKGFSLSHTRCLTNLTVTADGEEFDVKDQCGVGRDIVARAVGAVAEA